jgi:flagellar biosynthesis/type III secretory pathway M-ring protein FliF/YscJ
MDKKKFIDMDLIQHFVKKSKVKERKIQKEVYSAHLVFVVLFLLGFMGIIIFYKYLEKKRRREAEEEKHAEEEKEEKKRDKAVIEYMDSIQKNQNVRFEKAQVRNAVIQEHDEKERNQKEEALRKKFSS